VLTPTPDQVRERSKLLAAAYPDDDGGENDDALAVSAEDASLIVADLTGRAIGPAETPGVEVPAHLVNLAVRAVAMKAEQLEVLGGTARDRRKAIRNANLRSISAGPWSESYFGPEEAAKAQRLDPDPRLHEILWALATEEKRDYWIALWTGVQPPAGAVSSFDWSLRSGSYGRGL
jgi:hypothetical protein